MRPRDTAQLTGLWFDPSTLLVLSEGPTYGRGLMLFRNQKVLDLDIEPLDGRWLLLGSVQGSQYEPYEVSIEMTLTPHGHPHIADHRSVDIKFWLRGAFHPCP